MTTMPDHLAALLADARAGIATRLGITHAPKVRGRAYDAAAAAYGVAAAARDLAPPVMQAVTWCAWRAVPVAR